MQRRESNIESAILPGSSELYEGVLLDQAFPTNLEMGNPGAQIRIRFGPVLSPPAGASRAV